MENNTKQTGRDKAREFLKTKGKDPDKFLPKTDPSLVDSKNDPESLKAGADSSTETKKTTNEQETEAERLKQQERDTQLAKEAEEKRLLESEEKDLSEEDRTKKKELVALRETEREARRDANVQKRIDELVGEIKTLKSEKTQDKEKILNLESTLQSLKQVVEKKPENFNQKLTELEAERLDKYLKEDAKLPRDQRREMSRDEIENWMIEDIVSAQEWLTERNLRRRDEKLEDRQRLERAEKQPSPELLVRQKESQLRAAKRHPELNTASRIEELKRQGKSQMEIQTTILKENHKVRVVAEILKENPDKYTLLENGPELLVEEMERRLGANKPETTEERESRIAEEAREAERQRQEQLDSGLPRSGPGGKGVSESVSEFEKSNPEIYQKHLNIWKRHFPKLSDKELKSRLDKRLRERKSIGASWV